MCESAERKPQDHYQPAQWRQPQQLFSLRKRDPLTFVQHYPCDACIQPTAHATVHADNNACSHAYSHQPMQLCMQPTAHATVHADNYACSQAYSHQPMQVCMQPTTHATMHAANNQCTPRMQPITHETHATACPLGYPPTPVRHRTSIKVLYYTIAIYIIIVYYFIIIYYL